MKKMLFFVICVFLALTLMASEQESKKIYNIQKAYVYMEESLLISDSDLNCSYFIKDKMPDTFKIVAAYHSIGEREVYADGDDLVINQGSLDGLKNESVLLVVAQGEGIRSSRNGDYLGRYYLKKSLAEITSLSERKSVIRLKNSCHPVNIGDLVILFKPGQTVFAKQADYLLSRLPKNPVSGNVVYANLSSGATAQISGQSQYVTIDLGTGLVASGTSLLLTRMVSPDLPPLIIGLGIVIQTENTNSTMKILESNSPITNLDQVHVLPAVKAKKPAAAAPGNNENIPIVEALQVESLTKENDQKEDATPAGEVQPVEQKGDTLTYDVFFDFNGKKPKGDHSADFAAIKDFISAKTEYVITLRGYTCSIGSEEYNLRLAKERVDGIKKLLISQYGANAAHIETFFYGEKETAADNSSEAERQKNRLVKIEVSGK